MDKPTVREVEVARIPAGGLFQFAGTGLLRLSDPVLHDGREYFAAHLKNGHLAFPTVSEGHTVHPARIVNIIHPEGGGEKRTINSLAGGDVLYFQNEPLLRLYTPVMWDDRWWLMVSLRSGSVTLPVGNISEEGWRVQITTETVSIERLLAALA